MTYSLQQKLRQYLESETSRYYRPDQSDNNLQKQPAKPIVEMYV